MPTSVGLAAAVVTALSGPVADPWLEGRRPWTLITLALVVGTSSVPLAPVTVDGRSVRARSRSRSDRVPTSSAGRTREAVSRTARAAVPAGGLPWYLMGLVVLAALAVASVAGDVSRYAAFSGAASVSRRRCSPPTADVQPAGGACGR